MSPACIELSVATLLAWVEVVVVNVANVDDTPCEGHWCLDLKYKEYYLGININDKS